MAIKNKGVKIKKDMFPKIYDQGSSQTKLLSSMDYEKGKLNLYVLESKDQNKITNISLDINAINYVDKMDLHRQNGEMMNIYVMIVSLGMKICRL
jgi:hypothetical protein